MAKKPDASFFDAEGVVLVGYSKRNLEFSSQIRKAFEARGAAVYPVNPGQGAYDTTVYPTVSAVPGAAELAVVLVNKTKSDGVLEALAAKGVKRVLFGSKMAADEGMLARCAGLGMQGAVACPLMALGTGFHRFHGWLAGIPRLTPPSR